MNRHTLESSFDNPVLQQARADLTQDIRADLEKFEQLDQTIIWISHEDSNPNDRDRMSQYIRDLGSIGDIIDEYRTVTERLQGEMGHAIQLGLSIDQLIGRGILDNVLTDLRHTHPFLGTYPGFHMDTQRAYISFHNTFLAEEMVDEMLNRSFPEINALSPEFGMDLEEYFNLFRQRAAEARYTIQEGELPELTSDVLEGADIDNLVVVNPGDAPNTVMATLDPRSRMHPEGEGGMYPEGEGGM